MRICVCVCVFKEFNLKYKLTLTSSCLCACVPSVYCYPQCTEEDFNIAEMEYRVVVSLMLGAGSQRLVRWKSVCPLSCWAIAPGPLSVVFNLPHLLVSTGSRRHQSLFLTVSQAGEIRDRGLKYSSFFIHPFDRNTLLVLFCFLWVTFICQVFGAGTVQGASRERILTWWT